VTLSPPAACPIDADSRAFTDAALAELRAAGWAPVGWARFAARVTARSADQVVQHPRAAIEATALHAAFLAGSRGRGRLWILSSWAMVITHLGLLGPHSSLGWPNTVSLARANLPATSRRLGRWLGVVAVISDKLDGTLARRTAPTMFGFYADSLADTAFWTWFAGWSNPNRLIRAAALAAWVAPVATLGSASIVHGKVIESPRRTLLRPAAAMQAMLALRALVNNDGMAPPAERVSHPSPPWRNA
jgi:phosphatidylglycerophosphate synthase